MCRVVCCWCYVMLSIGVVVGAVVLLCCLCVVGVLFCATVSVIGPLLPVGCCSLVVACWLVCVECYVLMLLFLLYVIVAVIYYCLLFVVVVYGCGCLYLLLIVGVVCRRRCL